MVASSPIPVSNDRILPLSVPVIDMSWRRDLVLALMVRACEEFGFFKVINHGVSKGVIARMENECKNFFSLPTEEKKKSGPPNPLGYGSRNIGFNGDIGELEYLLLQTDPNSISQRARSICKKDPSKFRYQLDPYISLSNKPFSLSILYSLLISACFSKIISLEVVICSSPLAHSLAVLGERECACSFSVFPPLCKVEMIFIKNNNNKLMHTMLYH